MNDKTESNILLEHLNGYGYGFAFELFSVE